MPDPVRAKLATLRLLAVWIVLGVPAALVGIPWTLLRGNIRWMYGAGMRIMALGVRAAGVRVEVRGTEHLPADRKAIVMANHVSNLDPPVLLPAVPGQVAVLLKQELMQIPILGYAMRLGKFIPVERGARREAARRSVDAAASTLAAGLHVVVFPEGTRSPDGRLAAFKKGPFYLAAQTGAPIVPVAIAGTERVGPKGSPWLQPGAVSVTFLPAIEPRDYPTRDALMSAVHAAIAEALPEGMRPSAGEPVG